jgi:hypothetical protein
MKLQEFLKEKQSLERICAQLEKENAELKKEARDAGRKALQSKWTEQDEEEFLASRRLRREAQSLIKAPVHEHLEKVNYIYDIKNQWCKTNKTHFSLQFPEQFQRAPVLDLRDKAIKESEEQDQHEESDQKDDVSEAQSDDRGVMKGTRLSFNAPRTRSSVSCVQKSEIPSGFARLSIDGPRTRLSASGVHKPEPPTGFAALKRLTAHRNTNY